MVSDLRRTVRSRRTPGAIAATLLLLAGPGAVIADQVAFESETNEAVSTVLEAPAYDRLSLRSTQTGFTDFGRSSGPEAVTVTLARPPDAAFAGLPDRFETAVERRTGQRVAVTVEYVERVESSGARSGNENGSGSEAGNATG